MTYSEQNLSEIREKSDLIQGKNEDLLLKLVDLNETLKQDKAREFLMQGVGRRLKTVVRCLYNIFEIFPPECTDKLTAESLSDIAINLHAFFINIAGIFDNLGWVFVLENELEGRQLNRHSIGLFNVKTQERLNSNLREYLNTEQIKSWYENYSKNYRDALAHRIPLYIPPSILDENEDEKRFKAIEAELRTLDISQSADSAKYDKLMNEQRALGKVSTFFAHSVGDNGRPALIHPQIICDFLIVEETVEKFCEYFEV